MSAFVSARAVSSKAPERFTVLTVELRKPRTGPWHADVEIDEEVTLPGEVQITIEDSVFVGFVKNQRKFAGRTKAWIVGGNGGFAKVIGAQHYTKPSAMMVIRDILSLAGEKLSGESEENPSSFQHWERKSSRASIAMRAICEKLRVNWRVLDDGTVWVGVDKWEELKSDATILDEPDEDTLLVAADTFAELAKLQPGSTFGGIRIEQVTHLVSAGSTRTTVKSSSIDSEMGLLLEALRSIVANSNTYLCKVRAQNGDGTLQLEPEDERIAGRGLGSVPIRHGLPGFEVKVKAGAVVHVAFDGGDPSKPYASLWTPGNASCVQSIEYKPGGISSPVVRVGDQLEATLPMALPISGLMSGLPFSGVITVTCPLKAIVSGSGNPQFLA